MKRSFFLLTVSAFLSAIPAFAASPQSKGDGNLHILKSCGPYFAANGAAGSFCTISASDVREIPVGTTIFYDQAAATPAGFLDSNVLLYVAPGDWATGRCTVDFSNFSGLCTFSNGVGELDGFQARINVTPAGGTDFNWEGKYNFGGK